MLKNILNLDGVNILSKKEQLIFEGGDCLEEAWLAGSLVDPQFAYEETNWYYETYCI